MEQRVIISQNLQNDLAMALTECERDRIFVLTDTTTREKCWPVLSNFFGLKNAQIITIPAGDEHKNLESLSHVWSELQKGGATRHSCMINLGGGMVTDLGGFAASTFKRGMNFINIPTTLLSMVDASVGGKTGINFGGLKNEVGVFNEPRFAIINAVFLKTLDNENLMSGYAEMIKHGLISDDTMLANLLDFEPVIQELETEEKDAMVRRIHHMVAASVKVKQHIVNEDPREKGLRKALNFGHTVGHAIEAWSLTPRPSTLDSDLRSSSGATRQTERKLSSALAATSVRPLLHGYAVAFGMVCELYLSCVKCGFPTEKMRQVVNYIRENYGTCPITCDDYPELLELMTHDKKNNSEAINFTLLSGVGELQLDRTATKEEIEEAFDFLREG